LKGVDGVCLPRLSADIEKQPPDRALNSLRQRDPIENFADEKVSLNRGQVFSYDLVMLSSRKRNRLLESPGVSSSMTIRSTDILSLPPYTYLSRPALTEPCICSRTSGSTAQGTWRAISLPALRTT
jgi:hypothetical protein